MMSDNTMNEPDNCPTERECLKQEVGKENIGISKSDSKSSLPFLTRASSLLTWGCTISEKSESYQYLNDEEANLFPTLVKKYSLSGKTILPTYYGAIDDDLSECSISSYFTVTNYDDYTNDSCISIDRDDCDVEVNSPTADEHDIFTSFDKNELHVDTKPAEDFKHIQDTDKKELNLSRSSFVSVLIGTIVKMKHKSKGARRHQPAPHIQLSECFWNFFGSFITLYIICFLSENVPFWNESERVYSFPLGPFGALITLQYSLTDAAAAQPRSVIYGATFSGLIAMFSTYIPDTIIPITCRIAFATSASIALMSKLGVMHPPGGAIALVFAEGNFHWGHLLLTLFGFTIAISTSTLINNLNNTRQYPVYWDFLGPFMPSNTDEKG